MSFGLKHCSFVSVPSLFKKEINAFDSFVLNDLIVTVLSVNVSYGNTLMILETYHFFSVCGRDVIFLQS